MTDRLFQIFCSRSLRQYRINYKFHVSVRLLTIKISQWAREDSAVIVKNKIEHINPNLYGKRVIWMIQIFHRQNKLSMMTKRTRFASLFLVHKTNAFHWMHFSFLFTGREPTKWPAKNCQKIGVLLQIIVSSCVIETTIGSRSCQRVFRRLLLIKRTVIQ